jgi:acyl dehydratase
MPGRRALTETEGRHRVRVVTRGRTPHVSSPGTPLPELRVRARNLFRGAANRIHDDAEARRHGYAGALVAGVTLYGYLSRLAVFVWGLDWLARGTGSVRFLRPVYDGDELTLGGRVVARSANPVAGEEVAELEGRGPSGEVATTLLAGLAWGAVVVAPDLPTHPAAPLPAVPPPASADTLARLNPLGTPTLDLDAALLAQTADELGDPLAHYRGPRAVAHPALLLRQANRALAENVALGPWVHVASDVAHLGLAHAGDRLETRGRVRRVYERSGRGWVDLEVLVVANACRLIARIGHTAIHRLGEGPPRRG